MAVQKVATQVIEDAAITDAKLNTTGTMPAWNGSALTSLTGNVAFPATQVASADANTLDDYEEGTWTPVLGSATSTTYTYQLGTYTKIGRSVYLWGCIQINSLGDGSTSTIAGLPFTIASTPAGQSVPLFSHGFDLNLAVSPVSYNLFAASGGNTLIAFGRTAGQASGTNSLAVFGNGTRIDFGGLCQTA